MLSPPPPPLLSCIAVPCLSVTHDGQHGSVGGGVGNEVREWVQGEGMELGGGGLGQGV